MADRETIGYSDMKFLGGLPRDLLDVLSATGNRADYPLGTTIYREGDDPRTLLVLRGLLRVYMSSPEGRQVTVRYARPADVLGIAVLAGAGPPTRPSDPDEAQPVPAEGGALTAAAKRDARVSWALAEELKPTPLRPLAADGRQRVRLRPAAGGHPPARPGHRQQQRPRARWWREAHRAGAVGRRRLEPQGRRPRAAGT